MSSPAPSAPLPVGFRFRPTDEELVRHYLRPKIAGSAHPDLLLIPVVDLSACEPWELPARALFQSADSEWFFFAPLDRKYPVGHRSTATGFWKAMGRDRLIHSPGKGRTVIGVKKKLVFCKGRPPSGNRTAWAMQEYRADEPHLQKGQNGSFLLYRLFNRHKTREYHDASPAPATPAGTPSNSPPNPQHVTPILKDEDLPASSAMPHLLTAVTTNATTPLWMRSIWKRPSGWNPAMKTTSAASANSFSRISNISGVSSLGDIQVVPTMTEEPTITEAPMKAEATRLLLRQLTHMRNTISSPGGGGGAAAPSDACLSAIKQVTSDAQDILQGLHYKMILAILGSRENREKFRPNVSGRSSKTTSTVTSRFPCAEESQILSIINKLEDVVYERFELSGLTRQGYKIMLSLGRLVSHCILLCHGILGIMNLTGPEDTKESPKHPKFTFDDLMGTGHDKVTWKSAQSIPTCLADPIFLFPAAIRNLLYLDLSGCNGLTDLPASLGTLHNLTALNLSYCSSLDTLPGSLGGLQNMQILVLSGCQKLNNLPVSLSKLSKLRSLNLSGCSRLEILPDPFVNLSHLENLNLSDCEALKDLPQPFGRLQKLKYLNLSNCHGVNLDIEYLRQLVNFKCLTLSRHTDVQGFPDSFRDIATCLDMSRWWKRNRVHPQCNSKVASLHSFGHQEQSIISKLLPDSSDKSYVSNDQVVTSIFIVGESGMGKSELVRRIYKDQLIFDAFDLRIWVYVCENKKMLWRKIVEFTSCAFCGDAPLSILEEIVTEELTGKKFLLVLDDCDIQSQYFWSDVQKILTVGAKGSALIVTTKSIEVASLFGATQICYLSPLSKRECSMIINEHVFGGLDISSYPQLANVGWKVAEKCGGNPMCIKALSGLLCHSDMGLYEIGMLVGGILPALRLCYDLLPVRLQQCFKFCSLFPKDYIFIKNHIVRLWISQGFVFPEECSQPEETGLHYFDELLCRSFFQCYPVHNDQKNKFVMHELFHDLACSMSNDECFRSEEQFCCLPENVFHLSLVLSDFKTVLLTKRVGNLQTFLVVRRSFPVVRICHLGDLYVKYGFLRALNLSYTDILELPSSVGNMRHLQFLALNNTKIKGLPSEIGQVGTLQTLELKYCCHLIELPRSINNLAKLRHLEVQKELGNVQVGMAPGIGHLTDLQTLAVFNVGNDLLHCSIAELKNLSGLRGHVHITGLENVKADKDAKDANIMGKHFLEALTLDWSYNSEVIEDDFSKEIANKILQNLQPSNNLQEIIIRNYSGNLFPVWMQDSSLHKLVSVTLDNCHDCSELPCLGDLPSLKYLCIKRMDALESFGYKSLATIAVHPPRFPSLEVLTLWEMYALQFWVGTRKIDFPRLYRLSISRCPKLMYLPPIFSLVHLSFHCGSQVPYFSELPLLESVKIEGFNKIKSISFPRQIATLKKLEIRDCKELLSMYAYSLSVSDLKVFRCLKLDLTGSSLLEYIEPQIVGGRYSLIRQSMVLKTMTYTHLHDGGWNWKLYGHKNIFSSKFPRSYYRCICENSTGCRAMMICQPTDNDPNTLSVMYISEHNHVHPSKQHLELSTQLGFGLSTQHGTTRHAQSPKVDAGPTIRVKVKFNSVYHEIYIGAQASFGELKKVMAARTGLHPENQKVVYKDREWDSKAFLYMAGVRDRSKVVLLEDPAAQARQLFEERRVGKAVSRTSLVDKLATKELSTQLGTTRKRKEPDVSRDENMSKR